MPQFLRQNGPRQRQTLKSGEPRSPDPGVSAGMIPRSWCFCRYDPQILVFLQVSPQTLLMMDLMIHTLKLKGTVSQIHRATSDFEGPLSQLLYIHTFFTYWLSHWLTHICRQGRRTKICRGEELFWPASLIPPPWATIPLLGKIFAPFWAYFFNFFSLYH